MLAVTLALLLRGIDVEGMDPAIAPGDDFNAYANGTWLKKTPIPDDQSSYGIDTMLSEQARKRTADLIQTAGRRNPQVAETYATFMDEATIEAKGLAPLKPELQAIEAVTDKKALAAALGRTLRADVDPVNATSFHTANLLGLFVAQALDDPKRNVPYLLQGGLGLPDREYYLSTGPDMTILRSKYQGYVAQLLKLAGIADSDAKAARIVGLEKKLAIAHATRLESEDVNVVVAWRREELATKAPGLDWAAFLGAARLDAPVVYAWQPKAIAALSALVASESLGTWKDWLTFHLLDESAPFLPKAFDDAHFVLHRKELAGVPQQRERWKRAADFTSYALGEAVGRLYAEKYFSPEAKARAQDMVAALLKAFVKRIDAIKWMSPKTKAAAKEKVASLKIGVGYPDRWRDYSALKIVKGDALGNAERVDLFEYERSLKKLSEPVDRGEWWMNANEFNALNLPLQNALVFPAALLQPPLFDPKADPATNFGATGASIGHELSHSFDDMGAQFDAEGKLSNWWTKEDLERFNEAGQRLAAQYDAYEPLPGVHVSGKQTLSENIADVAGLAAAYDAYKALVKDKSAEKSQGFTGDQLFFIAYGQAWREKRREAALKQELITDGHSPEEYRCDTVRNIDGWYTAFGVKPGQKLFLKLGDRVRVW